MPHPQQDRNIAAPDAEVLRSLIHDWTASALSPGQVARLILQRINGTASTQLLLAAAIDVLHEQAREFTDKLAGFEDDNARLEDEVTDLELEVEELRAKQAAPKGPTP